MQPVLDLREAAMEASLILHSPPDFPDGTQIIGICSVASADMHPNRYGWMVADFLRWKSLFQGVGNPDDQVSLHLETPGRREDQQVEPNCLQ